MVEIKRGMAAEEFRGEAAHTLFFEGNGDESIDAVVLQRLFHNTPVVLKAMGPSSHIRSVADALHQHHPTYYFLVDRDHHDLGSVEKCWREFLEPQSPHLLIWRRRELENYFLIPEYISRSNYLKCSPKELQDQILEEAQQRIFLDAANYVIIDLREELKRNWIETFSKIENFHTPEQALEQLLNHNDIPQKISSVGNQLHKDEIARRFHEIVTDLFGGQDSLQYAHGSWLERVNGKAILKAVVKTCCRVKPNNNVLQGKEAIIEFVKDLLRLDLPKQPNDFQELHKLISEIIKCTK